MKKLNKLGLLSLALVIIGGLNWGLVGFFNFDLMAQLFGSWAYIIYDIVGLSALYLAYAYLVGKS
ncbi:MAG: DUF378 domain-containing protein [Candidatus Pacebacteria bacterium]|nr:DUF378 domain-containing protein [Candidatus Paceibacterota bacterium]MDD2757038.1 DUF378 domain-containing protein [Candidatus Paceibacterota bacterium]MDD3283547.1 DUF378 domain-containing protein [Candidatus Paceibacterota bacterium]MDD3969596.1 DUF378 domain-containing protein [Candidatus Paceibacterota bacterium]MDD4737858.1 DUF378 domain-containing protein [Candidatus Paceibacterota bacterium]